MDCLLTCEGEFLDIFLENESNRMSTSPLLKISAYVPDATSQYICGRENGYQPDISMNVTKAGHTIYELIKRVRKSGNISHSFNDLIDSSESLCGRKIGNHRYVCMYGFYGAYNCSGLVRLVSEFITVSVSA